MPSVSASPVPEPPLTATFCRGPGVAAKRPPSTISTAVTTPPAVTALTRRVAAFCSTSVPVWSMEAAPAALPASLTEIGATGPS